MSLKFNLQDGRQFTYGYLCDGQSLRLTRAASSDGSVAVEGSIAAPKELAALLIPVIAQAEALRDNNFPPAWKSRIMENQYGNGPFWLDEFVVLDTGRWGPGSYEFRAIIPEDVFERRADLRKMEEREYPLPPIEINGNTISVSEEMDAVTARFYAVVYQDGIEIFRIEERIPAGASPVRGLWAWQGQWVLEVEGHIIIDGKEFNLHVRCRRKF